MKRYLLIGCAALAFSSVAAQPFTAEAMAGNDYLFYQHLVVKKFSAQSRFGLMHIANVITRYQPDPAKGGKPHELMNQAYLTTSISKSLTLLTGLFYNNVTGTRAAIGLQYARPVKHGLFVVVPRADIQHHGSAEIMSMLEYKPQISRKIKLYTRLQVMSNYGAYHHNRSYQRLRLGISLREWQLGLAMNLDEYGRAPETRVNAGFFIRKEFF
jgi:hypothetical protein